MKTDPGDQREPRRAHRGSSSARKASNPASLPTKPSSGGRPAIDAAAAAAVIACRAARPQPGEPADVPRAGRVIDGPGDEEQRRLEESVGEQHRHPGDRRDPGARAEEHHEEPSWLTVPKASSRLRSVCAIARHPPTAIVPGRARRPVTHHAAVRHPGRQPGHQVHARLHHRRGVQVGAHRGRRGHRGRQPRVERQLRRLRQRPDEDQRQSCRGDGCAAEPAGLPERDDLGDPVRARRLAEQDEAQQHHQPAEHGDQQRLHGGAAVLPRLAALPHQQERRTDVSSQNR